MVLTQRQQRNFWNKVEKTEYCWDWTGRKLNGYGKVNINYKVYNAHRVSLLIQGIVSTPSKKGLGASGEVIMHICDNRSCVNPNHLKVATQKENMQDAKLKGRKWNGETVGSRNGRSKLSESLVASLKQMFSEHVKVDMYGLADVLGVNVTQLYSIKSNKSWRHVNPQLGI